MITLVCQDRSGHHLETLTVNPKDEVKTRKALVNKYKSLYIFAAPPSDPVSLSPARRAAPARKFTLNE